MEKKVENLIEQKLILTKNKTNFFKATVKTEEDELAKELSSIIQEIKVRKDEHDDKGIETETISDIARKI